MSSTRKIETRLEAISIPYHLVPTRSYAAVVGHYGREMAPRKLLERRPVFLDGWWWR